MSAAKEKIRKQMRHLVEQAGYDQETDHSNADGLLCAMLELCGEHEMVELFCQLDKWYA